MRDRTTLILTITSKPRILPLRAGLALLSTCRASLHTQTSREDELTDSSAETAQEGVEWLHTFIPTSAIVSTQTHKHSTTKAGSKSREHGKTHEIPTQNAIQKLYNGHYRQKTHKGI